MLGFYFMGLATEEELAQHIQKLKPKEIENPT